MNRIILKKHLEESGWIDQESVACSPEKLPFYHEANEEDNTKVKI